MALYLGTLKICVPDDRVAICGLVVFECRTRYCCDFLVGSDCSTGMTLVFYFKRFRNKVISSSIF